MPECLRTIGSIEKASSVVKTLRQPSLKEENVINNKLSLDHDNLANKLPDTNISKTPNKPFNSSSRLSGMFVDKMYSQRKSELAANEKENKENMSDSVKESSSKSTTVDTTPKEMPKREQSWTSSFIYTISKWITKEVFNNQWWKCSEQDKDLNCWSKSAKWVRDAEKKRNQTSDKALYLEEYENLKKAINQNYSQNKTDCVNKEPDKFEIQLIQIEKDIERTMNNDPYFGEGKEGRDHLRVLLKIIALKYTDIGYVQGMNFLVVSLLYHWSPEITLFLITVLMEDYEMWDVYREDMQGLHIRNGIIKDKIQQNLPDLYDHFMDIGIDPQMFTTEWVLDLFSHIIPISFYGNFLDNFFWDGNVDTKQSHGWDFFYQIIINILKLLRKDILQLSEWDEVLVTIQS